jgi:D-beta-D-heptose 7-phosphate kinase/D-beta-D-heptose 1-phosphate adenosyltransferase
MTEQYGREQATEATPTQPVVLRGLFEDASNFELRYVPDLDRLADISAALKTLGVSVVLTSGTFDLIHQGHSRYLEAARELGGFLIVGVDSDEKVRSRKQKPDGPKRPVIPQEERLLMVAHQRGVGVVTLKEQWHPKWALIEAVRPDVLVATEDTYTPEQIATLAAGPCGRVEVMARMATISTSHRIWQLQTTGSQPRPTG